MADLAEMLMDEYEGRLSPAAVTKAVLTAHRSLRGQAHGAAYGAQVHRVAKQILDDELARRAEPATGNPDAD